MKTLAIIFNFMAAVSLLAGPIIIRGPVGASGAAAFVGDLVDENCEGTGTPAGWTDTSTPNWDYTTAPAPLQGTQSLRLTSTWQTHYEFAGQTTVEGYCMFNLDVIPGSTATLAGFRTTGGTTALALARVNSTGNIAVFANGSDSTFTVDAISADTTYHLWWKFVSGGTCTVAFSTDGTRPTSGNKFTSKTGASGTAARMAFNNISATQILLDRIVADTGTIPDNP